jgi:hypothetical protein
LLAARASKTLLASIGEALRDIAGKVSEGIERWIGTGSVPAPMTSGGGGGRVTVAANKLVRAVAAIRAARASSVAGSVLVVATAT